MLKKLQMGESELRQRLLEFDRAAGVLHPDRTFYLVLAGGGALMLLGHLSRVTDDMDALQCSPELLALMEKYDINNRIAGSYGDHFPYNWEDRLVRLDIETKAVKCYAASLEDIVASKLCSQRPDDGFDVRRPEMVAAIDWDLLETAAKEMELSQLNPRRYQDFLRNFESFRRECGPCAS
ncbi:MAG: DUF6036 family nucleotidyltransferase [Coriobacteriia bacterium]|nr:DUF6036 family nucleotidyltransferase [Coriobacteriia bacterium]